MSVYQQSGREANSDVHSTSLREKHRRVAELLGTIKNIAPELADMSIWLLWRYETTANGKQTKVPYQPKRNRADTRNPQTWNTFDVVCEAFLQSNFDGIGFVIPEGYAALDLDDCIDALGSLTPAVETLISDWNSYTEITPSGRGLRVIAQGNVQPASVSRLPKNMTDFCGIAKIEIKGPGQYITFTGRPYGDLRPVADCTVKFEAIQREMQRVRNERAQRKKPPGAATSRSRSQTNSRSDDERIDEALARNADMRSLWDNNPSALAKYCDPDGRPDDSRADQALMNFIAPRVDFDARRAIQQMWRSELRREKWNREDYLLRTFVAAKASYAPGAENWAGCDSHVHDAPTRNVDRLDVDAIGSVSGYANAEIEYVVRGLIPSGCIVAITGESGCGKSTFVTKMVAAIASGEEFLGRGCQCRKVLVLDRENPVGFVADRNRRIGVRDGQDSGLIVWGSWVATPPPSPNSPAVVEWCEKQNPRPLVVVDSYGAYLAASGLDENSNSDARKFIDGQLRPLVRLGCTVLLTHNTGKSENSKVFRGAQGFKDAVDVLYLAINRSTDRQSLTRMELRLEKGRVRVDSALMIDIDGSAFVEAAHERREALARKAEHEELLRSLLAEHPGIIGCEFHALAEENGIAVWQARKFLDEGVKRGWIEKHRENGVAQQYRLREL